MSTKISEFFHIIFNYPLNILLKFDGFGPNRLLDWVGYYLQDLKTLPILSKVIRILSSLLILKFSLNILIILIIMRIDAWLIQKPTQYRINGKIDSNNIDDLYYKEIQYKEDMKNIEPSVGDIRTDGKMWTGQRWL